MDERIVLDEKSFKALSADSRIGILKTLSDRRKTLSEISHALDLGNSTVKEHCEILVQAGLIKQMDEGRKWKYYELTSNGRRIIKPDLMEETKVLIILCLSVFVLGGIIFFAMQSLSSGSSMGAGNESTLPDASPMLKATASAGAATYQEPLAQQQASMPPDQSLFYFSSLAVLVIGIAAGWIIRRRTRF